jgi:hypothetical protein
VDGKNIAKAYPDPRISTLKKIHVLTGYVQDDMKSIVSLPISKRRIDVSYRGRPCDFWLGKLAYDKQKIATEFIRRTVGQGFQLDISLEESDRLYGAAWLNLLINSRAVLGTESGASIWDFDETIEKKTKQFLKKHKHADFDAVYEQVLKPYDGHIPYNAISPRVFEAAATKTPMVMFPGDYSGVCKPDEHYIVLNNDFSNIKDVIEKLRDTTFLQRLADRTHNDLIISDNYSQHKLAELVGDELIRIIEFKNRHHSELDVAFKVESETRKYRYLNHLRRVHTETKFIISNFWRILTDPQHTLFSKIVRLVKGMRRYIAYLLPRLKRYKNGVR